MDRRRRRACLGTCVTLALLAASTACTQTQPLDEKPTFKAAPRDAKGQNTSVTRRQLQGWLYGYALTFLSETTESLQLLVPKTASVEERKLTQARKVNALGAAMSIVSNREPEAGLLDMIVFVTLSRMVVEDYFLPDVYGERARPVLEVLQSKEREIWDFAAKLIGAERQRLLRERIQEYRKNHPDEQFVAYVRLADLAPSSERNLLKELKASITIVGEIDETTRAIDELRMVGERMTIYLDLMPRMIEGQMMLLGLEYLTWPEVQEQIANVNQLTRTSAEFVAVVDTLPEQFGTQTQETLDQAMTRLGEEMRSSTADLVAQLAAERKAIVSDLESQAEPIRGMLSESRESLVAMQSAAQSINEGINSLDAFVGRWDDDAADTSAATVSPAGIAVGNRPSETGSSGEESPPFDVRDYGAAASNIAVAATELNQAIQSLDNLISAPSWEQRQSEIAGVIGQARAGGEEWLDRAFLLGLALMVVFFIGSVLTILSYRYLAGRILGTQGGHH